MVRPFPFGVWWPDAQMPQSTEATITTIIVIAIILLFWRWSTSVPHNCRALFEKDFTLCSLLVHWVTIMDWSYARKPIWNVIRRRHESQARRPIPPPWFLLVDLWFSFADSTRLRRSTIWISPLAIKSSSNQRRTGVIVMPLLQRPLMDVTLVALFASLPVHTNSFLQRFALNTSIIL